MNEMLIFFDLLKFCLLKHMETFLGNHQNDSQVFKVVFQLIHFKISFSSINKYVLNELKWVILIPSIISSINRHLYFVNNDQTFYWMQTQSSQEKHFLLC